MAKDRAAPFSRKHRRYFVPITGGMILIGILNVTLGVCTYDEPPPPQRIEVQIPGQAGPRGTLDVADIPAPVMRAFAVKYPKTIPAGANIEAGNIVVLFPTGAAYTRAVFRQDGTFVRDE